MSNARRTALAFVLGAWSIAVVTVACGAFDAEVDDGPSPDASADGVSTDAPSPAPDAPPDAAASVVCRGGFAAPIPIPPLGGLGASLRSMRGTGSDGALISFDTSPDDDIATATLEEAGLRPSTPNALSSLNTGGQESHPTSSQSLDFIVFASSRQAPGTDGAAVDVLRLWYAPFNGTSFEPAQFIPITGASLDVEVGNPYLVGDDVYFDVQGQIRVGRLSTSPPRIALPVALPGLPGGTHPVVTTDASEIYFQVGGGVAVASRALGEVSYTRGQTLGQSGDYPTWIAPDGCRLYVIHQTGSGAELRAYDRAR